MIDKMGSDHIMKIGIVVYDIEKAAGYYEKLFHFEEKIIINHSHSKKDFFPDSYQQYKGKKINADMRWCIVDLDPIYIQIIEPNLNSASPWTTFLKEHGPGVCFMTFCVEELKDHIEFMEQNNLPLTFLEEKGFERYAYFDTQEIMGLTIELKERKVLD